MFGVGIYLSVIVHHLVIRNIKGVRQISKQTGCCQLSGFGGTLSVAYISVPEIFPIKAYIIIQTCFLVIIGLLGSNTLIELHVYRHFLFRPRFCGNHHHAVCRAGTV
ncbi:hypothetical protein Barb7_02174 [Bacteroidales bacterium Barb7]|nr:hypothetical protein Barb7_02174 [Bacteroidales bacterium Barb7]